MKPIRILGVPLGLGTGHVRGTDLDWDVRTDRLAGMLNSAGFSADDCGSLAVPYPAGIGDTRAKFLHQIAETCERIAVWTFETSQAGKIPLVVGGDHSIAVGSVAGVSDYFRTQNQTLGLLWLDAHADMNTPETSPSGHVHGMALAGCVGLGAEALTTLRNFSPKVRPENTIVVGARDIDRDEVANIRNSGIKVFTIRDVDERGMAAVMSESIAMLRKTTSGIHLSLDMDVLDPAVAPAVSTPVPGGLTYREAHLALEIFADSGLLTSLDLVEFNPALDGSGLTAKVSAGLVASAFGKSILPRAL